MVKTFQYDKNRSRRPHGFPRRLLRQLRAQPGLLHHRLREFDCAIEILLRGSYPAGQNASRPRGTTELIAGRFMSLHGVRAIFPGGAEN